MLFLTFKPPSGQFQTPPFLDPPPTPDAGAVPPYKLHPPSGARVSKMVGPDWADGFLGMLAKLVARIDATRKVNDVLSNVHEACAEADDSWRWGGPFSENIDPELNQSDA